jgi:hypothetical protein
MPSKEALEKAFFGDSIINLCLLIFF